MKILTKKFVITFYITTFASDNKRFLCLFVKFVLYRGPVLWEKHWTFFCIYTSRRCGVYFSGFARKYYIVLRPWLTHGQPVHDRRCQCQYLIIAFFLRHNYSNLQKITYLILRNLFGLYLFSHQSCATGTLLLRK